MNTQSSITRAWSWSVERSPLLNATRWILNKGYPNTKALDLINAAELPSELTQLIDTTVTKTKLWRSERAEIARELITHTQDALEADRTVEQIVDSFGNPKKVAKLLRRATKRKRPLYWRTLRNIRRSVVAFTLLIFITYGSLAARFFIGQPNIKTNYAVMINSQNDAYTEDQKAWPVYKEVRAAWDLHILDALQRQNDYAEELNIDRDYDLEAHSAGLYMYPQIPTDHHDYEETVQLFKAFEPQFKRLREATHRPIIGIELGFDYDLIDNQDGTYSSPTILPSDNAEENPSLINMLLPHLGKMRQFANILAFETLIAARESDDDRTYENLSAMLALSRQESFDKTLISSLVNIAIANLTTDLLTQVVHEFPGILTRDQLVALSHELVLTRPSLMVTFQGEIMMFDDILQRAYTDDGNGNGRITLNGLNILANEGQGSWNDTDIQIHPAQYIAGPATLAIVSDRKTQSTRYNALMDAIQTVKDHGPQMLPLIAYHDALLNTERTILQELRFSAVDILTPALGQAVTSTFRAHMTHDATATMLAVEIYTLDNGHPPTSLIQLTPHYLPNIPKDLFDTGQPLKYKLTDNGYIIYSVGSDADDDHATPYPIIESRWMRQTIPNFGDRYPYQLVTQPGKPLPPELNADGTPKIGKPIGPDGDWILIDMTTQTN